MLIACLSDIHGNLPALAAACADAKRRGADAVYCAGDLTGYGPFPSGVCEFLARRGITTIAGNYDRKVLEMIRDSERFRKKMKPLKWRILSWTGRHLDARSRRYIAGLGAAHRETLPGGASLLMVHGSPLSDEDTIYPSVTAWGLRRKLDGERADVLVCGHTHIPFARRIGGTLVVNCGSAGQPVDGDPRPPYALITVVRGERPTGRIVRFSYAVDEVTAALRRSSLPDHLIEDFTKGNKKREAP
jgi:predicted phosphodiesterase